jgi:hypothetical protein
MPPKRDEMEITHPPPEGWRCDAHDDVMRSLGRIEGRIGGLDEKIMGMSMDMKDGFGTVRDEMRAAMSARTSDTRALRGTVRKIETWQIGAVAVVGFLMIAIPIVLTVIGYLVAH